MHEARHARTFAFIWLVMQTGACETVSYCEFYDNCNIADSKGPEDPDPALGAELQLDFSQVKQFDFSWTPVAGAEHYQLLERESPNADYVEVGPQTSATEQSLVVSLFARTNASYKLRSCGTAGCTDSEPVSVAGTLAEAVGYFKASNTDPDDWFGASVASSEDGTTLAVGAPYEKGKSTGINGDDASNNAFGAGAVYVFVRDQHNTWRQQAYIKVFNINADEWSPTDLFGSSVALSADGNTLAVGAKGEDSNAIGIDTDGADNSAHSAGAAYVFIRDEQDEWSQQAYIKASNTDEKDQFGTSVSLSADGNTLAVGADNESSSATGSNGDQADNSAPEAGAAYVFIRDGQGGWSQQVYLKASSADEYDHFGTSVTLSGDGRTLAVGAIKEDSSATGINGDATDNSTGEAGAVYVFVRDEQDGWSQQAYVKASNPGPKQYFGSAVVLNGDGNTLAVGSQGTHEGAQGAEAVYVFVRDEQGAWSQQRYLVPSNAGENDWFGSHLALSRDGNILAVGARNEDGGAVGLGGQDDDNSAPGAGGVFTFVRNEAGDWSPQTYVKASNTESGDCFGVSVALSGDGRMLAVGAPCEGSNAIGVNGDQSDNTRPSAGAVYLY